MQFYVSLCIKSQRKEENLNGPMTWQTRSVFQDPLSFLMSLQTNKEPLIQGQMACNSYLSSQYTFSYLKVSCSISKLLHCILKVLWKSH